MNYECTNTSITFHNTDCFETILDFLEHYKQSKKNRYLLLLNKQLYLNDTVVKDIHEKINGKDIKLLLDKHDIDWVIGKKTCTVLYKDDFILAVHKDAGCIMIRTVSMHKLQDTSKTITFILLYDLCIA